MYVATPRRFAVLTGSLQSRYGSPGISGSTASSAVSSSIEKSPWYVYVCAPPPVTSVTPLTGSAPA